MPLRFDLGLGDGEGVLFDKPITAKIISVVVATMVTYAGNRTWTWRHRERSGVLREYSLFFLLNGVGLAITVLPLAISHYVLGLTSPLADNIAANVVGLAMGFAVIPIIFSIAEDAVFGVPKTLSDGSLALGATPWQTLLFVILPTASPGIFSALMIGLGRAVGETMIVLMATGNTPVMDWNIFEGMRTLAANIAVEMPESEVNSTHYRILFLAALVLFLFTFVVNTVAELVRQRLREKYSSL